MISTVDSPVDNSDPADSPVSMPSPATTETRQLVIEALLAHAQEELETKRQPPARRSRPQGRRPNETDRP